MGRCAGASLTARVRAALATTAAWRGRLFGRATPLATCVDSPVCAWAWGNGVSASLAGFAERNDASGDEVRAALANWERFPAAAVFLALAVGGDRDRRERSGGGPCRTGHRRTKAGKSEPLLRGAES